MGLAYFDGKRALVTGGSSGIGYELAKGLAQHGAHVAIVARGEERLQEAVSQLRATRADRVFVARSLDVADRAAVQAAVPEIVSELGGLDLLVNNAGVAYPGYVEDVPAEVFEQLMQINYFGMVNMTLACLPVLRAQGRGAICNVSSLAGLIGIYGYTAYGATKFAMRGFSESLRQDLVPHGISVHIVFPPDTETPQLEEENRLKPEATRAIAGNVKAMQPEEVAQSTLEGIAAGRFYILPGGMSKFSWFMFQHFPGLVRFVLDGDLKKHLQKTAAPKGTRVA